MIYALDNETEKNKAIERFKFALDKKITIELKQVKNSRTAKQNRALHKFFVLICEQLNEMGREFVYTGIKGTQISTRYTPDVVKNYFWRPIQISLFDVESTTKLDTKMINEIADVIIKFFGEKSVLIDFPRKDLE